MPPPCKSGCTCGKHRGGPWKGKTLSKEHRESIGAGLRTAAVNGINVGGKGTPRPKFKGTEQSKNLSAALKVRMRDPEVRANHIAGMATRDYDKIFAGGKGREPKPYMFDFARALCPAGYVMDEVTITLGPPKGGCYTLDFAHIEAKVDIEIDGASHKLHQERDAMRDAFLRERGWKVIRIKL